MRIRSALILALPLMSACATAPENRSSLRFAEDRLGTNDETSWSLHRVLEDPRGFSLHFPGYLIAFEKSEKKIIGGHLWSGADQFEQKCATGQKDKHCLFIEPNDSEKFDQSYKHADAKKLESLRKDEKNRAQGYLKDGKHTLLTHLIRYDAIDSQTGGTRMRGCSLYDAYSYLNEGYRRRFNINRCGQREFSAEHVSQPTSCMTSVKKVGSSDLKNDENIPELYSMGWDKIENLADDIAEDLKCRDVHPTHIILYSMGWNTPQREALQNYNSLFGGLLDITRNRKDFRPLIIGISWPSLWQTNLVTVKAISYFNKANDADEMGMVWMNLLIDRVAKKLRDKLHQANAEKPKIVLIGHSLGARIISRAVFSSHLLKERITEPVDLVIGLEAAFSIKRFLPQRSNEGAPFRHYQNFAKKFIYTWSEFDKANTTAFYTALVGSKNASKVALDLKNSDTEFNPFQFPKTTWCGTYFDDKRPDLNRQKISFVDASCTIRNQVPFTGGVAHSDIYKREVSRFIWESIRLLNNDPRDRQLPMCGKDSSAVIGDLLAVERNGILKNCFDK